MDQTNKSQEASTHVLTTKEKVSYGLGDLASNFVWGMVSSYLLYFYTDVYGLAAGAVGTLFLVARIWDAVNDPIMGAIVDRTNTKHGKARPYLLYLAIPLGVISVLTFMTPDFSYTGKLVYAYVTYILLGMVYTAINIPYGALMPMLTQSSEEKAELGSFRAMGLGLGSTIVGVATLPMVSFFGRGNDQLGFPITMAVYSVIGAIMFIILFRNSEERYTETLTKEERENPVKSVKKMIRNTPWVMVSLSTLSLFLRLGIVMGVLIYFVNYVLEEPQLAPIFIGMAGVGNFVGGLVAPPILKRLGNRTGAITVLIASIVPFIILIFIEGFPLLFAFLLFVSMSLVGAATPATYAMVADTADYQEWKFGSRLEGLLYASFAFAQKFGIAIGSALVGYALAWIGYDPDFITPGVQSGLRVIFYTSSILLSILQFIPLIFYKLDDIHSDIVRDLRSQQS